MVSTARKKNNAPALPSPALVLALCIVTVAAPLSCQRAAQNAKSARHPGEGRRARAESNVSRIETQDNGGGPVWVGLGRSVPSPLGGSTGQPFPMTTWSQ